MNKLAVIGSSASILGGILSAGAVFSIPNNDLSAISTAASDIATSLVRVLWQLLPVLVPLLVVGFILGFVISIVKKR